MGEAGYRLRSGVTLVGNLLVSVRPLVVTRLNDRAVALVEALETEAARTPAAVASETGVAGSTVEPLFDGLHERGFLAWEPASDPDLQPPVSVIVTVRNDREHLETCLDALAGLSYPDYEVVVVDDRSTDGTGALVAEHGLGEGGRLRYLEVGSPDAPLGIGASRNRGVAAANHDVLAFTDADCRPRPDWLSALVGYLDSYDAVGGRIRPADDDAASVYEGLHSSLDMGPRAARVEPTGATPYLATANLVGRRAVFEAVGFPERNVAEDVGFCWRAIDAGHDLLYVPSGVVEHDYRSSIGAFARRRAAYGASEALLAREHGRTGFDRVALPVTVLGICLVLVVGALLGGGAWTGSLGLAGVLAALGAGVEFGTVLQRYRRLSAVVGLREVLESAARGWVSSAYALCRELTRYYLLPLLLGTAIALVLGGSGTLGGLGVGLLGGLGVGLLGALGLVVALPAVVDYTVHDPAVGRGAYLAYYLADHLGYGVGVYRGLVRYRTLAHLSPASRVRLSLPGR